MNNTSPAPCEHPSVTVEVGFCTYRNDQTNAVEGYHAEIRLACATCKEPFTWIAPAGSSLTEPRASVDGKTLRAPVAPESARRSLLDVLADQSARAAGEA